MQLAPEIRAVTQGLMALLDKLLPSQLEAFYLVGSVAQNDYRSGESDVDFVAVMAGPVDLAALAAVHAQLVQLFPGLDCDGIYLRQGDLSGPPAGSGIAVRAGMVDPASADERHPVTWLILADDGVALRGRRPGHDWIAANRKAAIAYSRANLETYWRGWVNARRSAEPPLDDAAVVWGALGIARLHATITTGKAPSKTAAGLHALTVFDAHHPIIKEALRLRANRTSRSTYRSPWTRQDDLKAFMDAVFHAAAISEGRSPTSTF